VRLNDLRASLFGLIAAVALNSMSGSALAGIVAGWDFDPISSSAGATSPYAPAQAASELTIVGLTRGFGVSLSSVNDGWGGNLFNSSDAARAEIDGKFITFSLTPNSTTSLSLSNIDAYNVRRSSSLSATMGQWQYDVGSGYANIGSAINWGSSLATSGNAQPAIDLSGISSLQNIAPSTTVTFRLLVWGGLPPSFGTFYLNDPPTASSDLDFSLQGTLTAVSVPEPSGLLMGALASALVVAARIGKRLRRVLS